MLRECTEGVRRPEMGAEQLRAERAQLVFPQKKKLIQINWRVPSPAYVRGNIRRMEEKPFDGTIIHLHERAIFHPKPFAEASFLQEYEDLAAIEWGKFTDNFIWTVCNADLDWFDEGQWQAVLHNTRIFAKAALFGRCAGIVFDAEDYGHPVFSYRRAKHGNTRSFAEYERRVRRCGAEWIQAVQEELPRTRILDLWLVHSFITGEDRRLWSGEMTPEQARALLREQGYGLVPAFVNGMLQAAAPETLIIDGNEGAYYYESEEEYRGFVRFAEELLSKAFIDPKLWGKYRAQVSRGSSYYNGYCYGHFQRTPAPHLTDAEKARWLEHNVYWALVTSHEYVWEWLERQDWWQDRLEPHYEAAVRSARRKVEAGEPLGYEVPDILDAMTQRAMAQQPALAMARVAGRRPTINGRLTEKVWETARPLHLWPTLDWNKNSQPGRGMVAYDDQFLYIAFRCTEPETKGIHAAVKEHDSPGIIYDDNVEVVVSRDGEFPVHQFMGNARGVTWDAIYRGPEGKAADPSYDPEWWYAARIGRNHWSAEFAIPWVSIGMASPQPGAKLRLNLARFRLQGYHHGGEKTCWSPAMRWDNVFPRFNKARIEPRMLGEVALA